MRRMLATATVMLPVCLLLAPQSRAAGAQPPPVGGPAAHAPAAAPATAGTHRAGHAAPLRAHLSSALTLGLPVLGGGDDAGVQDAFPGTGIPRTPAHFAPDVYVNQDRSALPHNETSVAINPRNPHNLLVGANDYSLGFGSSGFYASFDGGSTFYGGMMPMPTVYFTPPGAPNVPRTLDALDGGGDPSVAFDRDGVAYYAEINFHRVGCITGVFVFRSTNGGQTWSRPLSGAPSPGDTRNDGDGVVAVSQLDVNCQIFYDKEMIAAGRRPNGVSPMSGADPAHISSDRLYAVFSEFAQIPPVAVRPYAPDVIDLGSPTFISYSDDQGRHWSTPTYIDGTSSALCSGGTGVPPAPVGANECADSQGADVAVDPRDGSVYVAFWNGDNPNCSGGQVLTVKSSDGGATFGAPTQAACPNLTLPVATAGSTVPPPAVPAVCADNAGETLVSGYCFRVPTSTEQSIAVNPKDGSVHVAYIDNAGGTDWDPTAAHPSDLDVFTVASTDGAGSWGGGVRVNRDPHGDKRDQFFPWCAFAPDGTFYVSFMDRALDAAGKRIGESLATSHDNGASFTQQPLSTGTFDGSLGFREGLFLGDYTGLAASSLGAYAAWPDTRRAAAPVTGDNPTQFWSDVVGRSVLRGHAVAATAAEVQPGLPNTTGGSTVGTLTMGMLLGGALVGMPSIAAARRRRRWWP